MTPDLRTKITLIGITIISALIAVDAFAPINIPNVVFIVSVPALSALGFDSLVAKLKELQKETSETKDAIRSLLPPRDF